jgi:hypothetical protein
MVRKQRASLITDKTTISHRRAGVISDKVMERVRQVRQRQFREALSPFWSWRILYR